MKKLIILIIISFGFGKLKAQTFSTYADTANYLIHEIEYKKSLFVNKPFSVLLDSLKIQPVHAANGILERSNFGKSVGFYFNLERAFDKKHFITVDFDSVPAYAQLFPEFYPAVGQLGTIQSVVNIYYNLIVKNVGVKRYTDDEPVKTGIQY
jgi:hypothetical protein